MHRMRRGAAISALLVALTLAAAGAQLGLRANGAGGGAPSIQDVYGRLPLSFEPGAAGFSARGPGYAVQLQGDAARLLLGEAAASLALRLHGARTDVAGEGRGPLPGRVNHLTGDPAGWRIDVPTYARVSYAGVYDGIDVDWYGAGGQLEFDLIVAPGADPARITLGFDGAQEVRLDAGGSLVVAVAGDSLVQRPPVAYQDGDRGRRPVAARYVARGDDRFGVTLGDYDRSRPVVIDPVVVYSTLLGGLGVDEAYDIKVDGTGSAYVVGYTASSNFPTAGAVQGSLRGGRDAAVFKLNPAGTALVYSTFLGGVSEDYGLALDIDGAGAAYVAGFTTSRDSFPLRAPAQSRYGGGSADAFVIKLEPSGSALAYGTYLGGAGRDTAASIAVDGTGNAYVVGTTASTNFPTAQARQPVSAGEEDAFVARLSPSGAVVYATYLGGAGEDYGMDIGVDGAGNAVVVGITESTDFPTHQPVQGSLRGYGDGFVTRLDAGGANLLYSTYLGGTDQEVANRYLREGANAVAVDTSGNAYVTGFTDVYDFPTFRAMSPTSGNGYDAFVTKLSPAGAFVYSTYLGSSAGSEAGEVIAVDGAGNAHIGGWVAGAVPAKDPLQSPGDWHDAFVSKLNADGSALLFSTNLGGGSDEIGRGVAVDGTGAVYVVGFYNPVTGLGQSAPYPFPTKAALQPQSRGSLEMFVVKIGGLQGAPVIAGSTWYADGSKSQTGPAGTALTAYAVGGLQGVPYQLVLAAGGKCANTVAVLNAATIQVDPSGVIGRVRGTIPAGTPPGTYDICFRHNGGATATGLITFVVG